MTADEDANRWVAHVDGVAVAESSSPFSAASMAAAKFPERTPTLTYTEAVSTRPLSLSRFLEILRPYVDNLSMPVYLVGGAVRDAVMEQPGRDVDLAVPSEAIQLAYAIGDALHAPAYVLDDERDVGRVTVPQWQTTIDVARFRGSDLDADLYGRDFTINAMALPATAQDAGSIIDPTGGLADIQARLIRVVHPNSISDDPVRALRAIRQALQFDFTLTAATVDAVRNAAPSLHQVSPERIRDELVKLIIGPQPDRAVSQMAAVDLLAAVLPEVAALNGVEQSSPHHEPVFEHTLSVLRWLLVVEQILATGMATDDATLEAISQLLHPYQAELMAHLGRPIEGKLTGLAVLRLGALFHDIGKPQTQTFEPGGRIRFLGHDAAGAGLVSRRMKALAFSNEAADGVAAITGGHMRPLYLASDGKLPSRRTIYRFYRATHDAGLDIVLLSLADHLATYDGPGDDEAWQNLLMVAAALLGAYFTLFESVVRPIRLLSGSDLIQELELRPGPDVGRLLGAIEEAQASGRVTTREEALALARGLLSRK